MFANLPVHSGPDWTLYHDDCRARLAQMPENSVDSIVTDPPYHLTSVTKRMGADNAAPVQFGKDGAYRRAAAGFMGKRWDGGDVAFQVETWAAAWRVLKPGGYLFAFSGSRTFHRMTTAIDDAGFIIHPLIGWAFGSGFPKAHNLSRAIDQELGTEGGKIATGPVERRIRPGADRNATGSNARIDGEFQAGIYVPATPEAAQWQGWFYGGQVRKPALEPICVAQKPFSERNGSANVLRWGVGAVNIDGVRVDGDKTEMEGRSGASTPSLYGGGIGIPEIWKPHDLGRWPANLIHDGSPEVLALFPDTAPSSARPRNNGARDISKAKGAEKAHVTHGHEDDGGSAARFFECYPPDLPPIIYCPKAGRADRAGSVHPTVKPQRLMRSIIRHGTPPGGVVLDMFAGSGSTLQAARAEGRSVIGIEADAASVVDTVWRMRYAT